MMARSATSSLSRSGSSLSLLTNQDAREAAEYDFNSLIVNISDELEGQHVDKIRYLHKRDLGGGRHRLSSLKILEKLEEKGIFSFDRVLPLKILLQRIHRFDLVPSVQSYAEAHSSIVTDSAQGLEKTSSCSSLLIHTTSHHDHCGLESEHGENTSLLSCPSDLGTMATQAAMSGQFISQESLEETTEPHSKSLLVSRNVEFEYSLPDCRSTSLNLPHNQILQRSRISQQQNLKAFPPPPFLTKNTGVSSGPQVSSVQCIRAESVKPSQDTITTLQDNLHRTNDMKSADATDPRPTVHPTESTGVAVKRRANFEQSCPPSPVNKIRSEYLRQSSQTSQCSISTLKANCSSNRSSSSSSELYATPDSSPLLHTHREHASYDTYSKPTTCTEASISEHRSTDEDWQTHSITSYVQGANCFVGLSSSGENVHQHPLLSSRLKCADNHRFEMTITSQPISREVICRMICRLEQQGSIAFQDELNFSCGPRLKLWLNPRGTEEYCSLKASVTIAKQYWPQSDSIISMVLCASIQGNNKRMIQGMKMQSVTIGRECCNSPQMVAIPDLIMHKIITHDITDSFLSFVVTAKICHNQFTLHISETPEEFVNIDFMS